MLFSSTRHISVTDMWWLCLERTPYGEMVYDKPIPHFV